MPARSLKHCAAPGCHVLVRGVGRCDKHAKAATAPAKQYDKRRGTSAQRGYGYKWQQAREGFLAKHPLCIMCMSTGIVKAASVVDHIKPHRGDQDLFWDRDNWQPLCAPHHSEKTAREDGGYGNAPLPRGVGQP